MHYQRSVAYIPTVSKSNDPVIITTDKKPGDNNTNVFVANGTIKTTKGDDNSIVTEPVTVQKTRNNVMKKDGKLVWKSSQAEVECKYCQENHLNFDCDNKQAKPKHKEQKVHPTTTESSKSSTLKSLLDEVLEEQALSKRNHLAKGQIF